MPRNIIKDRAIVEDSFQLVTDPNELPASGDVLIDLAIWSELEDQLKAFSGKVGVQVPGETELDEIQPLLDRVDLIAINFPAFKDGRGYSLARLLRERLNFQGELRAVGDVLRDQLFYLNRCGFNSFAVREDRDIEEALTGLNDFSVTYQADAHEKRPIYLRRA